MKKTIALLVIITSAFVLSVSAQTNVALEPGQTVSIKASPCSDSFGVLPIVVPKESRLIRKMPSRARTSTPVQVESKVDEFIRIGKFFQNYNNTAVWNALLQAGYLQNGQDILIQNENNVWAPARPQEIVFQDLDGGTVIMRRSSNDPVQQLTANRNSDNILWILIGLAVLALIVYLLLRKKPITPTSTVPASPDLTSYHAMLQQNGGSIRYRPDGTIDLSVNRPTPAPTKDVHS